MLYQWNFQETMSPVSKNDLGAGRFAEEVLVSSVQDWWQLQLEKNSVNSNIDFWGSRGMRGWILQGLVCAYWGKDVFWVFPSRLWSCDDCGHMMVHQYHPRGISVLSRQQITYFTYWLAPKCFTSIQVLGTTWIATINVTYTRRRNQASKVVAWPNLHR